MANDTGIEAYVSLGSEINKQKTNDPTRETTQGISTEKLPELVLEMSDEEIIKLATKWEKSWKESPKKTEWEKQIEENEKYWLGQQFDKPSADKSRPQVDNLIFEALETYLPQATRRNPEPMVSLDNSEKGENGDDDPNKLAFVEKVKGELGDLADKNVLRLKLKKAARHWAISQLGVIKYGWDLDKDIPTLRTIRPKKIILDPDATIDEDGYTGDRIGEYRKLNVSKLLSIIGEKQDVLGEDGKVKEKGNGEAVKKLNELQKDGDTGTEVTFVEWWTPQYMCWVLEKTVLMKKKNPHWNYDSTENPTPDQLSSPGVQVDTYGNATANPITTPGINHFMVPKMPYEFLSIFNLGDQPMDRTSLIGQNLANQDAINKRNRQIDKNADSMNGGMVVSLARSGLTAPQAKGVTEALKKGGTVAIPDGAPRDAIDRYPSPGLPADIYNELNDKRARLRDIFGVSGSSRAGLEKEQTVRGKIMSRSLDTDRIGGGVSEYLEQLADASYNWFVQLLYVYDTKFQFVPGAVPPKILVSVKEGSMLPKDSTSIANQALELAGMGKISTLDLYKRLEWPNAEEVAANVWLEANAPELLYRNNELIAQAVQMRQQAAAGAGAKPPSESISYKDLPPEGKTQMAAQAGITLHPDTIAANDANVAASKAIPKVTGGGGSALSEVPIQ